MNFLAPVIVVACKYDVLTVTAYGDLNTKKNTSENETIHYMDKNHKKVMLLLPLTRSSSIFQN